MLSGRTGNVLGRTTLRLLPEFLPRLRFFLAFVAALCSEFRVCHHACDVSNASAIVPKSTGTMFTRLSGGFTLDCNPAC
jgi:hypothetical protein